jgi:acyl-CoA thioesterase YciA
MSEPRLPDPPGGPHLRTIAMPADANPSGHVFGGWTLSQMDLAGATLAADRAQGRVATIAIEAMRFLQPIRVGDQVSCFCSVLDSGDHSIQVRIETWTRSRGAAEARKVTEGVFTYVAIGDDGHPRELPDAPRTDRADAVPD